MGKTNGNVIARERADPVMIPVVYMPVARPAFWGGNQAPTSLGRLGKTKPNPTPYRHVKEISVSKLVEVPLRRLPIIITMAAIPAAFRTPIRSASIPPVMASNASVINGVEKSRLTWALLKANSSLIICAIGGIHNIGVNIEKPISQAHPSMTQEV